MNIYSVPPLIVSVMVLAGGLFVFLQNRRRPENRAFALLCAMTFIWQFSWFVLFNTTDPAGKTLWIHIGYTGIIFIPVAFFHFVSAYLGARSKGFLAVSYAIGLALAGIHWSTDWFINGWYAREWGSYPRAGLLHPVHLLQVCFLTVVMLWLLARHVKEARRYSFRYNQIKYIILAVILYFPAAGDYLVNYGYNEYPFGFVFVTLAVAVFGYAAVKFNLMDVKVAITRAGIFIALYCVILGLPFLIAYETNRWVLGMFLMAVLGSAGPFIYRIIDAKAAALLLAQQKRYQNILVQASEGMTREHDLKRLLNLIVHLLTKTVQIRYAVAYLEDRETGEYQVKARRDTHSCLEGRTFAGDHPLVRYLKQRQTPARYEELAPDMRRCFEEKEGVRLIVPSVMNGRLLGFLILGEKLNNKFYTEDDIRVFMTLANQASLAISNCFYIEEFRSSQERLFAAEKLASIGGMADGVAHQIKNRLNQFSIVAGEQQFELEDALTTHAELLESHPELKKSVEYALQASKSIVANVKKTAGVIQGILNFARTEEKETGFSEFPAGEVIGQVNELLNVKHQVAEFPLAVEIAGDETIYGVKSQLVECLYNLLDNAYEAVRERMEYHMTEEERKVFKEDIRLRLAQKERATVLEIRDNGIGIKEENRRKMFAPFFTTKSSYKSGSGIGIYVVRRMIEENHRGRISFESEYGQGTTFRIELPRRSTGALLQ